MYFHAVCHSEERGISLEIPQFISMQFVIPRNEESPQVTPQSIKN